MRKEKKSVMQRSHYRLAFSSFELSYKSDGVRKKQEIEVETGEERDRQRQTDRQNLNCVGASIPHSTE